MQFSRNHVGRMPCAAAVLLAVALMFSAIPVARAQEVAVAEMDGRVSDPSGGTVANATVKMTEVDTRQLHTFTTGANGERRRARSSGHREVVPVCLFSGQYQKEVPSATVQPRRPTWSSHLRATKRASVS